MGRSRASKADGRFNFRNSLWYEMRHWTALSIDNLHTHLHDLEVPEQRRQSFLEKDFAFYHCKYLVTNFRSRIVQGEKNTDLLPPENPTLPAH